MLKSVLIGLLLSLSVSAFGESDPRVSLDKHNDEHEVKTGAVVGLPMSIPQKAIKLEFPVERVTLSNGMVFLLHSQRSIPMVSYHTWFRVGAKDELPGESGLAHMFEHMMFKGTQRFPNKDFDRVLQANGIVNNAFTTQDYTGYFEILPSSKLELIMDMEADRLQSLQIVDDEFQKEREVVKEERRMRYDNDPSGMGWEKLTSAVFQNSNYGLPVIGTAQDISGFNIEKLKRFYSKWYVPSNAVVVIVGDFDVNQVKKLIKKYYGSLKSPERPSRLVAMNDKDSKVVSTRVPFPVQGPELMWGSLTVKGGVDDAYALDLLSSIFGQGKSSRLYQELVYKQQVALSAASGHYTLQDSGMFYIQVVAKPGSKADQIRTSLEAQLERLRKLPIKPEELLKAKNMVLSDYIDSLRTNDGKARILAMNEVLLGDYREFFRDIDRYLKVSVEDIERVKSYIAQEKFNSVTVDRK
ncbi:MAG: hypothetical protein RJB66_482 [Pseudomonadota bacterium]|jgi:zinc protease